MRRKLIWYLALYIDFIVIGTFVALGNYFFALGLGYVAGVGSQWYFEIGVTAGLTALARLLGLSMGEALLDYALAETNADSPRRLRFPRLLSDVFFIAHVTFSDQ